MGSRLSRWTVMEGACCFLQPGVNAGSSQGSGGDRAGQNTSHGNPFGAEIFQFYVVCASEAQAVTGGLSFCLEAVTVADTS